MLYLLAPPIYRWILDTSTAVERNAITVLLSSPDGQRYKEFAKLLGCTKLYMPVWTDEEIHTCRYDLGL